MRSGVLATVAFVACTVAALAAAERATFILTDGERKSGQIAFHGGDRENVINGQVAVGNDTGGPEFNFPLSQVAVIDFVGGTPPQTELAQVPPSGHFMTLKTGQSQGGTFVNIIDGNTVIWKNTSGETQRYNVTDLKRIYLNPDSARTVFNYSGPSATGAAVGTSGQTNTQAGAIQVQVQANQAWNDGGITVKKGDRLQFSTTGQVNFGPNPGMTAGPQGSDMFRKPTFPLPNGPVGALLGRIGTGAPFAIGNNPNPISMPGNGRLMLGVNDDELGDNSGAYTVTITKMR
jgi:hypothetical protein